MDFHTDVIWCVAFGIIGGTLAVLGLKIWEARQETKTGNEVDENRGQETKESVFQHSTGKEPQEHDE